MFQPRSVDVACGHLDDGMAPSPLTPEDPAMRVGLPHLRSAAATAGAATLLLLGAPAALAAPGGSGGDAAIQVTSSCTAVQVTSSKAISNVVLQFTDGDRQRFEDLPESRTGTFAGTGDHDGQVIAIAWVKSGNNKTSDGPGYGERFELSTADCDEPPATTSSEAPDGPVAEEDPQQDDEPPAAERPGEVEDDDEDDEQGGQDDGGADDEIADVGTTEDDDDRGPQVGSERTERTADAAADQRGEASGTDTDDEPRTAVATTSFERDTPTPDLAPQVLGVVLDRGVAAAGDDIRSAGELPATGGDPLLALLTALGAIGLGGATLRRTHSS
jgi:hypothetical protein